MKAFKTIIKKLKPVFIITMFSSMGWLFYYLIGAISAYAWHVIGKIILTGILLLASAHLYSTAAAAGKGEL